MTMDTYLAAYALVLLRLAGFSIGAPGVLGDAIPAVVKYVGLAAIAAPAAFVFEGNVGPEGLMGIRFLAEFSLGLWFGLMVRVALSVAEMAAEMMGMQLGFGFGATVDPMSNSMVGPLDRIMSRVAMLLFVVTDLHLHVVKLLLKDYGNAQIPQSEGLAYLRDAVSDVLIASIELAFPIVALTMASHLMFGLLTRIAPGLNLWSIGFLGSIGVGLIGLVIFLPGAVQIIARSITDVVSDLHGALE